MENNLKKYDYFISHSSEDNELAFFINGLLKNHGKTVFDYKLDSNLSKQFGGSINAALKNSRNVIIIYSNSYSNSSYYALEATSAIHLFHQKVIEKIVPLSVGSVDIYKIPLLNQFLFGHTEYKSGYGFANYLLKAIGIDETPNLSGLNWNDIQQEPSPFLQGLTSIFTPKLKLFSHVENYHQNEFIIKQIENNFLECLLFTKTNFENFLREEDSLKSLASHAVLFIKIKGLFETLASNMDDFNLSSFSLRLISLTTVFEREYDILDVKLKAHLKALILEAKNLEILFNSDLAADFKSKLLLKTPKSRGNQTVFEETRAYLHDKIVQNTQHKVLINE